jgi:hypothetical protein
MSAFLVLALLFALLPALVPMARAAGEGTEDLPPPLVINDANYTLYLKDDEQGLYKGSEGEAFMDEKGVNWTWDNTTNTLTLINFNFTTSNAVAFEIHYGFEESVTIALPRGTESSFTSSYTGSSDDPSTDYDYNGEHYLKFWDTGDYWQDEGIRAEDFTGGAHNNTDDDATLYIDSAAELGLFGYNLLLDEDHYDEQTIVLAGNINLSAHKWYPVPFVGTAAPDINDGEVQYNTRFVGSLEASGESEDNPVISGLSVNYAPDGYAGLFSYVENANIERFTLEKPEIHAASGLEGGDLDDYNGVWKNWLYAGALAGEVSNSLIAYVTVNEPDVTALSVSHNSDYSNDDVRVGGIAGHISDNTIMFSSNVYGGNVDFVKNGPLENWGGYHERGFYLGGIVGGSFTSAIMNCESMTSITLDYGIPVYCVCDYECDGECVCYEQECDCYNYELDYDCYDNHYDTTTANHITTYLLAASSAIRR